jgi:hypothetical protein
MRPISMPLSARKHPAPQPPQSRRPGEEKAGAAPKPAPKRCLNEAAHKLDR